MRPAGPAANEDDDRKSGYVQQDDYVVFTYEMQLTRTSSRLVGLWVGLQFSWRQIFAPFPSDTRYQPHIIMHGVTGK